MYMNFDNCLCQLMLKNLEQTDTLHPNTSLMPSQHVHALNEIILFYDDSC